MALYSSVGTESMGRPLLFGDLGVLIDSDCNLVCLHNSLMYAVWDNFILTCPSLKC